MDPDIGTRIPPAATAALSVWIALGVACEGTNEHEPDARSPASSVEVPAEPSPPPPPPPGAFELPGLRERAPGLRFGWPTESVHLTSSFGWRVDPVSGLGTRLHRGIDLRGSIGDLVLSIGPGTVAFVGHDPLLGNLVIVDHGDGLQSLYGHLSDVLVVSDVPVDRGAAIGLVGNTGRSAAPHLHLTVTLDGKAIDPLEILGEPPHRPRALVAPLDAAADPAPSPAAP
ncbi:M23 family metallopeptidase [Paraliomyxa miuraensis]|uniref:M23 family metallopeptidase n=1 Tax=Paraliomyxa miuraensis TaxID=376150 RepID=UPI002259C441|nr:M23 family metallopeptidase [Paraliomyxa miuraensis]MCX4245874.1 M23 family metallopeptidase [Paraliomyxa miuraensis]